MLPRAFIPLLLSCLVVLPHCTQGMKDAEPVAQVEDPAAATLDNQNKSPDQEKPSEKPEFNGGFHSETDKQYTFHSATDYGTVANPPANGSNFTFHSGTDFGAAQGSTGGGGGGGGGGTAQREGAGSDDGSWSVKASGTSGFILNNNPSDVSNTAPAKAPCGGGTDGGCGDPNTISTSTSGWGVPAQIKIGTSTSSSTKNPSGISISDAYVLIDPNAIGNDFNADTLKITPKPKLTVADYCQEKYDECAKGTTGPSGMGVCTNAYTWCIDLNNCDSRRAVCHSNETLTPGANCFYDYDVCGLEALCRNKKTACVADTKETQQCEGDREACTSKIRGHLAECVSQKDGCLADGGFSECYSDYESCKKTLGI